MASFLKQARLPNLQSLETVFVFTASFDLAALLFYHTQLLYRLSLQHPTQKLTHSYRCYYSYRIPRRSTETNTTSGSITTYLFNVNNVRSLLSTYRQDYPQGQYNFNRQSQFPQSSQSSQRRYQASSRKYPCDARDGRDGRDGREQRRSPVVVMVIMEITHNSHRFYRIDKAQVSLLNLYNQHNLQRSRKYQSSPLSVTLQPLKEELLNQLYTSTSIGQLRLSPSAFERRAIKSAIHLNNDYDKTAEGRWQFFPGHGCVPSSCGRLGMADLVSTSTSHFSNLKIKPTCSSITISWRTVSSYFTCGDSNCLHPIQGWLKLTKASGSPQEAVAKMAGPE